jgi:hypothetical protein
LPKTWSFSPGRFFAFKLPRTMAGVTYKYSGGVARYRQVPGRVGRASEIRYRSYAILSPVARPMVPLPSLTLGLLVSALLAAQEARVRRTDEARTAGRGTMWPFLPERHMDLACGRRISEWWLARCVRYDSTSSFSAMLNSTSSCGCQSTRPSIARAKCFRAVVALTESTRGHHSCVPSRVAHGRP